MSAAEKPLNALLSPNILLSKFYVRSSIKRRTSTQFSDIYFTAAAYAARQHAAVNTVAGKGDRHTLYLRNSAQDFKARALLAFRSAFPREAPRLARDIHDQNQGPRDDQSHVA